MHDQNSIRVSEDEAANAMWEAAQRARPTLIRDTCLAVRDESLRAAAAISSRERDAVETAAYLRAMGASLTELDELVETGLQIGSAFAHARRARSNCARAMAVCVRSAVDWRYLPQDSARTLAFDACLDPEAHSFPLPAAA